MSLFDHFRGRNRELAPVPLEPVTFPALPSVLPADVFTVPVLVVNYFPSVNGQIQRSVTGDVSGSVDQIRAHTQATTARVLEALQLGSIYHGYKDAGATPSLKYEVVESIEFLEPMPTWSKPGHSVPMVDYSAIVERVGIERWVREHGVKEVWVWGYHGGVVDLWESNMSGPFGDISNSDRDPNDLPVLDHTYTVYQYNYGRGASEAVEDHMHQIEAVLRHVDEKLFWEKFVGKVREGRCGWAHFPPNGEHDYDWANRKPIPTDIEDWTPDGGPKQTLNSQRWSDDSLTWFIYWMQNLPGRGNDVTFRDRPLTNWWRFIGDWDEAMRSGLGLVE